MRFAGELFKPQPIQEGIALLPGGVQGPAQGPNIPIKNYGGQYMPDATQPTGYRPGPRAAIEGQEVALAPAIPAAAGLLTKAAKAYGAFKFGQTMLDGGRVNSGLEQTEPGTRREHNPIEKFGQLILRNDY